MKIVERVIHLGGRGETYHVYPIGDAHVGKINCSEKCLRSIIRRIASDKRALWFGGGDLCECIKPADLRRFDLGGLPDWILTGKPTTIRERMRSIVRAQRRRIVSMLEPIKDKCLGLIEGNHEFDVRRFYNEDIQGDLCYDLGVPDLTDCAFLRLRFKLCGHTENVDFFVTHGCGGGRSAGAEPNHLTRLIMDKDADVVCRGHSHTYFVMPPVSRLYLPGGAIHPDRECKHREIRAFNWGCYVLTYAVGPGTYESRATYQARPLMTCAVCIQANKHVTHTDTKTQITIEEIKMDA